MTSAREGKLNTLRSVVNTRRGIPPAMRFSLLATDSHGHSSGAVWNASLRNVCEGQQCERARHRRRLARMRTWIRIQTIGGGLLLSSRELVGCLIPSGGSPFPVRETGWEAAPNGTGSPLYSWRLYLIVPMGVRELNEMDVNYGLPWNSPGNRDALAASSLYTYEQEGAKWVKASPAVTRVDFTLCSQTPTSGSFPRRYPSTHWRSCLRLPVLLPTIANVARGVRDRQGTGF